MQYVRLADANVVGSIGLRIGVVAIIRDVQLRQTKAGKDMMTFDMADGAVTRQCTIFDMNERFVNRLNNGTGKVFDIVIDVKPYDKGEDGISCILFDICEHDVNDIKNTFDTFVDSVKNIAYYIDALNNYLNSCTDTIYGIIAKELIQSNWDKFSTIPAASSMHHNLRGGLLQHSVSVAMCCINDFNIYNNIYGDGAINYALLVSGALIHDIGKCFELEDDGTGKAKYSDLAAIQNHTMRGIIEITKVAQKYSLENTDEVQELIHMVAAHHGKAEWGASIEPRCIEAVLLNCADDRDAKVNRFCREIDNDSEKASKTNWTANGMETVYKGIKYTTAKENFDSLG